MKSIGGMDMGKIKQILGASFLLLVSAQANAVIIGDKDWKQVSETSGYSWSDFDAIFDISTGACNVSGCLLGGSIDLAGYVWANNVEVNDLFKFYIGGIGLTLLSIDSGVGVGVNGLDSMFTEFTPTQVSVNDEYIYGYTREQSNGLSFGDWMYARRDLDIVVAQDILFHEVHGSASINYGTGLGQHGAWIYKTIAVNEPSVIALLAAGLLVLGFARRKQRSGIPATT